MAFGDIAETITGSHSGNTTLTVTYASATPAADDLNVLSAFTGAASISTLTSGFTRRQDLTDGANSDEGTVAEQLVTGGGDDTCTMTVSASDEIMMVMSLIRGAFAAGVDATGISTGPQSTDDPQTTGSGQSTTQADEVLVGCLTQRNATDEATTWARLGTAAPTTAPPESGTVSSGTYKRVYQCVQVLTGTGTIGITASNPEPWTCMLGFATFKKEAAGGGADVRKELISAYMRSNA